MRLYARMGMVDRACLPDKNSAHPPPGTDPNPNLGVADTEIKRTLSPRLGHAPEFSYI